MPRTTRCPRLLSLAGLGCLLATGLCGPVRADNWPGWRGPHRNGVSDETGLPATWTESGKVLWKTPLPGSGVSGPIVWGDRVFVTAADGPKQADLHVICLGQDDGRELWHVKLWGTAPTLYHETKSSMATPTPVTDGDLIYAAYGTGDVFCVDKDGGLVWQRSLATEYGAFENRFAASSSPLLYGDLLLLQCDHYGASYVLALDKHTGANRWKADRPECWLSWSTPQLAPTGKADEHELIVCGSHKVDAFNPLTGEKLWTLKGLQRECIPTAVYGHGLIYAVSGPKGSTFAIRPGGRGEITEQQLAWTSGRGAPFVPSPILVGDQYYLIDDKGIATCLDARTGKQLWQKRLPGEYTASPVAGDGKVYFTNEAGETLVLRAHTEKYEELARNPIGEPCYASPAFSRGRLFLRTASRLCAIGP